MTDNCQNIQDKKRIAELEALLAKKDTQIAQQEKKIAKQDKKIANQDERLQLVEQQKALLQLQVAQGEFLVKHVLNAFPDLINTYQGYINAARDLNKQYIPIEAFEQKPVVEAFVDIMNELNKWANYSKSYYNQSSLTPSKKDIKDATKLSAKTVEQQGEIGEFVASLQKLDNTIKRKFACIEKSATQVVKNTPAKELDELKNKAPKFVEALEVLATVDPAEDKEPVQKNGKRSSITRSTEPQNKSYNEAYCPKCPQGEEPGKLIRVDTIASSLLSSQAKLSNICNLVSEEQEVSYCPKCGKVTIALKPDQSPAPNPNYRLSMDLIIALGIGNYLGIPTYRLMSDAMDKFHIGGSTIYRNIIYFSNTYLVLLYDYIQSKAKEKRVLLADETPFSCLASQQKVMTKEQQVQVQKYNELEKTRAQLERELTQKEATNAPIDQIRNLRQKIQQVTNEINGLKESLTVHGKNYIMSLTTSAYEENRLVLYYYLPTRSTSEIYNHLKDFNKLETLCTDGHVAYEGVLKLLTKDDNEKKPRKHQTCMIHTRRELIKVLPISADFKEFDKLEDDELIERVTKKLLECDDITIGYLALAIYSRIYAYETPYNDSSEESKEQRAKLRKAEGPVYKLVTALNNIMAHLGENKIKQNSTGTAYTQAVATPLSKACVYYKNHQKQMENMLTDPMIPLDTNVCEQTIRHLAVLRSGCFFKVNKHSMQSQCIWSSVIGTAKMAGINDVEQYLRDFARALWKHCMEKVLTQDFHESNYDATKLMKRHTWDMAELSNDFDIAAWDPWEYAKNQQKPEKETSK